MTSPVIEVQHLHKTFTSKDGLFSRRHTAVCAVDDVSFTINQGEIVGLVGESGSGKTTLARVILRLVKPTSGTVKINGVDTSTLSRRQMKRLRRDVAVVFQDPASNLNPRQTVESSIMRPMLIHGFGRAEARERARESMEKVKMDAKYLGSYPHQLSGGQLQRIAVARALVLRPKVMVLDEPTSALDISIQAQVLNLLLDLQEEMGLTYLIITHDLNVIRYVSDKIAVMYLGQLVEYGQSERVMLEPVHPYTRGLMAAAPVAHPSLRAAKTPLLRGEPGCIPAAGAGCRMAPRCQSATEQCLKAAPALSECLPNHYAACHLAAHS